MILRILISSLLTLHLTIIIAQTTPYVVELRNGQFFKDSAFQEGVWYSVNGVLSTKMPARIDTTIDLHGRWVVPALGDALCLSIADNNLAGNVANLYAEEGFLYLLVAENTLEGRAEAEKVLAAGHRPEAAYANGLATSSGAAPVLAAEAKFAKVYDEPSIARKKDELIASGMMAGNAYWTFDTKEDVKQPLLPFLSKKKPANKWKQFIDQKPQALILYLRNTGAQAQPGMNPEVAKMLAKNGHKAKIPVFAYVETVADVRLALSLGVDALLGLPGANWDGKGSADAYRLSDEDLALMAKKGTAVAPLFALTQHREVADRKAVQTYQSETLKRLFNSNVKVCMGSGDPQRSARNELNYWFQLGGLNIPKALHAMCETTPQVIFPNRKIGRIAEGYEANLVVLDENPMGNILKVRNIWFTLKGGKVY